MEIVTPNCYQVGCHQAAVAFRQFVQDDPDIDSWAPVCEIHVFQPHKDADVNPGVEWRICFITIRKPVLQLSPS